MDHERRLAAVLLLSKHSNLATVEAGMKTHTPRQQTSDWSRRKPSRMACAVAVVVLIGITLCSTFECLAQSGDDKNEIVEPQLLALRDPELLMPPPSATLTGIVSETLDRGDRQPGI